MKMNNYNRLLDALDGIFAVVGHTHLDDRGH